MNKKHIYGLIAGVGSISLLSASSISLIACSTNSETTGNIPDNTFNNKELTQEQANTIAFKINNIISNCNNINELKESINLEFNKWINISNVTFTSDYSNITNIPSNFFVSVSQVIINFNVDTKINEISFNVENPNGILSITPNSIIFTPSNSINTKIYGEGPEKIKFEKQNIKIGQKEIDRLIKNWSLKLTGDEIKNSSEPFDPFFGINKARLNKEQSQNVLTQLGIDPSVYNYVFISLGNASNSDFTAITINLEIGLNSSGSFSTEKINVNSSNVGWENNNISAYVDGGIRSDLIINNLTTIIKPLNTFKTATASSVDELFSTIQDQTSTVEIGFDTYDLFDNIGYAIDVNPNFLTKLVYVDGPQPYFEIHFLPAYGDLSNFQSEKGTTSGYILKGISPLVLKFSRA